MPTLNEQVQNILFQRIVMAAQEQEETSSNALLIWVNELESRMIEMSNENVELEEKLLAAEAAVEMYRNRLTNATNLLHAFIDEV